MAIAPKTTPLAPGRKKALLIGIGYKDSSLEKLNLPHEDVKQLREFLIGKYEYAPENITVMLDGSEQAPQSELQPTLRNIRKQAHNLVAGARPNDHFFFYYSGHSVQVPELSTEQQTELDGKDEVMVPSNGNVSTDESIRESCLVDNELKRLLINPLPAEATFMAVLDTCHSASLLDLDHVDAWEETSWGGKTTQLEKIIEFHNHAKKQASPPNNKRTPSRKAELTHEAANHIACGRIKYIGKPSGSTPMIPGHFPTKHAKTPVFKEYVRCSSPVPDPAHLPLVISLSACKDDQVAVENTGDKNGRSFTERLLNILRENPHPKLRDLLSKISISIHGMLLDAANIKQLHDCLDSCQDPQMYSQSHLDMESSLKTL
ncbi:peptidase C14, caspase domain-containing protein [Mycena alexandri]|uniref:Peptidase C14, caspase domain-containing protein n=1 Tax=Mycena alexandri TaxID=1745969 RepID=A0AAD6WUB9_9AGAR|nr:peptidase C14, caspase domain-containing protein [Mycena alexandri]